MHLDNIYKSLTLESLLFFRMVKYQIQSFPLCPFGRSLRAILNEKKIAHKVKSTHDHKMFAQCIFEVFSPSIKIKTAPYIVVEYLEDCYKENQILYGDEIQRLKIRQMIDFVERKMYNTSTKLILFEKIINKDSIPDSSKLQEGYKNLTSALSYLNEILFYNSKIAGEHISAADLILASHLSCLDYVAAINWQDKSTENLKIWYSAIKSRPRFKSILDFILPEVKPSKSYFELDF